MARNYQDKANVAAAPDSIIATKYGGGEITSRGKEIKNAVSPTGQTLAAADGTAEKFNQLAQALFINATGAQTFQDGGAADAYVVTPVTGASGLVVPDDYDNMNGAIISFIPAIANTGGAVTIDLGQTAGTLLGTKKALTLAGGVPAVNALNTTNYHEFRYDTAADGAVGAWIFIGKKEVAFTGYLYNAYAKISDTKTSGVDGGGASATTWHTRDLTSPPDSDDDGIASVAANQVTLGAGTYVCSISMPAYEVGIHTSRLYDTTGTAVLLEGTSEFAESTNADQTRTHTSGQFTLATSSALEVQHYTQVAQGTNGLGYASSVAGKQEVYTIFEIWRVA